MASASKKLLKELPSVKRMNEIISDLKNLGPQTTAIMGAAYLEHALESLIRASFRPLPKKEDDDRLFSGGASGALGTFSAKIRIAYAAWLIHENVYKALLLINDIRNVFAHSLHRVDFSHELVAEDCRRLRKISPNMASAAGLLYEASDEEPIEVYSRIAALLYRSIRHQVEELKEPLRHPEDDDLDRDLDEPFP